MPYNERKEAASLSNVTQLTNERRGKTNEGFVRCLRSVFTHLITMCGKYFLTSRD